VVPNQKPPFQKVSPNSHRLVPVPGTRALYPASRLTRLPVLVS
jgi:hypothetical protein